MRILGVTALVAIVVMTTTATGTARPALPELYSGIELYHRIAATEALRNQIPFEIVTAVMAVESGYEPGSKGDDGEVGLMQVLPSTAALMGYEGLVDGLFKPEINIAYGTQYLGEAWRLSDGDICTTTMKYRAGHGETRFSQRSVEYCVKVRSRLRQAGFPVTGTVPKPTTGFGKVTKMASGRVHVRFPGTANCFLRVIQPGSRFGACISRRTLKAKKLLR